MNIDKLHATESTNDYLKLRFRESKLSQLHTVITDHQTAGKGQMGAVWAAERGKNLTFSTLLYNDQGLTPFEINKLISVSLVQFLSTRLQIPVCVKWPNDILSVDKKIAGILIENFYKGSILSHSIIGIGLNVNQTTFDGLPKASSLSKITGKFYDLNELLIAFLEYLQQQIIDSKNVIDAYESCMYAYQEQKTFIIHGEQQEGLVLGVDDEGCLILQINGVSRTFDLKEVVWMY